MSTTGTAGPRRIESLDQFRGYTVAGMFLVNYIGGYVWISKNASILQHHNTFCSYADTIMPQFFFAVGFAFRLSFGRRQREDGTASAYWHVVRRMLGLILVGMVLYTGSPIRFWQDLSWQVVADHLKSYWFQTLVHIAVTSIFVLPVITAGQFVRVLFMFFFAGVHILASHYFYFDFVQSEPTSIDGGPLGFLTWQIPVIMGSLACDWMKDWQPRGSIIKMIVWSLFLMILGYGLSCLTTLYNVDRHPEGYISANASEIAAAPSSAPRQKPEFAASPVRPSFEGVNLADWPQYLAEPPFIAPPPVEQRKLNYWMMSQRAGSASYQFFGAGFSLLVYLVFVYLCDILSFQLGMFRTLGTNALAGYIIHGIVDGAVSSFFPKDSPAAYLWLGFFIYFGITYLFLRHLEKSGIYLKL